MLKFIMLRRTELICHRLKKKMQLNCSQSIYLSRCLEGSLPPPPSEQISQVWVKNV